MNTRLHNALPRSVGKAADQTISALGLRKALLAILLSAAVVFLPATPQAVAADTTKPYRIATLASALRWPWSVAALPEGGFLISEREGRLLHLRADGSRSELTGLPATLFAGQGGFLDVALHPEFRVNSLVYLSFVMGTESSNALAIYRGRLAEGALHDGGIILELKQQKSGTWHYGGRMLFKDDKSLLLATGDGLVMRESAQDPRSELGKVLRVDADGKTPADNPPRTKVSERIWTTGHRNPQGLALDRGRGRVLEHEHGPKGGDELNVLVPRDNYGWPAVTLGLDYSGVLISPFTSSPDMVDPLWSWNPSIAPSGMAVYEGRRFPELRGSVLVGALGTRDLRVLSFELGEVAREQRWLGERGQRIRDVRVHAGRIYVLTDGPAGELLEILPP